MGTLFAALFFILLTFIDSFNLCRGQCEGDDVSVATYGPSADQDEVLNQCENGCQGDGFDRTVREHIGNSQDTVTTYTYDDFDCVDQESGANENGEMTYTYFCCAAEEEQSENEACQCPEYNRK